MIQRYFREELPQLEMARRSTQGHHVCENRGRWSRHPRGGPELYRCTDDLPYSSVFFTVFFIVFFTVFFTDLERSTVLHLSSLNFLYCKNRRRNCSISVRLVSNTDHNEWLRFVWILIPAVLLQIFKHSFFSTL